LVSIAIIVQAEKGKTVLIISSAEYSKKVHKFLAANNFLLLSKVPTYKYTKLVQKTLQQCNLIVDKRKKKFLVQKKPSRPTLKTQLKLHKPGIPKLPVISNMKAPIYKISKHLVRMLSKDLTFNNHYNVVNATNLANELTKLNTNENHKLITYDIKDLYVNIPIEETLTFTKSMLLKNSDTQTTQQIITLKRKVLSQNYFTFRNKIYQLEKGVSMGSSISSTMAEIFLQNLEDMHIKQLLGAKNTILHTLCRRHLNYI